MAFCPDCRFEYLASIDRCPNCGTALVPTLPGSDADCSQQKPDPTQVRLCTVTGEIHAKLLQDTLASQGILSRAQPGWSFDKLLGTVQALPPPIGGTGSACIAIFVSRSDLPRALVVHEDFESRGLTEAEWEELPDQSDEPSEQQGN